MIIRRQSFFYFLIVLSLMCSVHFWGLYYRLSEHLYDVIDVVFYGVSLYFLLMATRKVNHIIVPVDYWVFNKPIICFYFFLGLSTISCALYHNQFPLLTALAMRFFVFLLLYYILMMSGVGKDRMVKLVLVFTIIYMVVFSLQLLMFPNAIVPLGRTTEFDRGFLRLRLEGVGFVTMSGFYFINKYLNEKKVRYLAGYALCFLFVFILGFRTLLATYIMSSLLLVFWVNRFSLRSLYMLIPLLFLLLLASQLEFVQEFLTESMATSEQHMQAGDDYIRFHTFNFLFNEVNPSWVTIVFGNGQPFVGTTYGNYVWAYGADVLGYISADLGLVGFVFNYGLITCLLFVYLFVKGIRQKLEPDSVYLKVFFVYLIVSSFTTAEIYRAGMFGPVCVALYLINISNYNVRRQKFN